MANSHDKKNKDASDDLIKEQKNEDRITAEDSTMISKGFDAAAKRRPIPKESTFPF